MPLKYKKINLKEEVAEKLRKANTPEEVITKLCDGYEELFRTVLRMGSRFDIPHVGRFFWRGFTLSQGHAKRLKKKDDEE